MEGESEDKLPDAIFYDFGGQDYYHGIYRVFLSADAIYLFVWNNESNENKRGEDNKGLPIYNFNISYWLGQKSYFEKQKSLTIDPNIDHQEKQSSNSEADQLKKQSIDPILLIQTHADKEKSERESYSNQYRYQINNEFYVSLLEGNILSVNPSALVYLKASIDALIEQKKKYREEPRWFKEFIQFILDKQEKGDHKPVDVEKDLLPKFQPENTDDVERIKYLRIELDQFHKKGLILYYPELFPNLAWLNPTAFAVYVHSNIFKKENVIDSNGIISTDEFKTIDDTILALLKHQKVIFEYNSSRMQKYIIPNYLSLAKEEENNLVYELLTFEFIQPYFTLKFKDFLHIGLINQLICEFGKYSDKYKFWRNQLLFTFLEKYKILIQLDFNYLEVKIFIAAKDAHANKESIAEYFFYCIIGLYWGLELLDYDSYISKPTLPFSDIESRSQPKTIETHGKDKIDRKTLLDTSTYQAMGLYISLDEKHFVDYQELSEIKDKGRIRAYLLDKNKKISKETKEIPVSPFQIFTTQTLTKMKKVFVSYSHDDIIYRKELQKYLINLEREGIIEIWQDGLIKPGEDWDMKIKDSLEKADIIILLVSQSFITSNYVHEVEMRKSLKKVEEGSAIIIPVLLKNCDWKKWKVLPENLKKEDIESKDKKGSMGSYQFFPMDDNQRLKPVNRWEYQEDVWTNLADYIRNRA